MVGYTKLSSDIIHSSVWQTPLHVKVVWITMLALADKNGEVHASIVGLAKAADVTLDQCQDAIDRFSSPDPYSRTKDNDGKRIEEIDGGWALLNHAKYRNMMSADDLRSKAAERQRRYRERNAHNVTSPVTPRVTSVVSNDIQIQMQKQSTPTVCAQPSLLTTEPELPVEKKPRKPRAQKPAKVVGPTIAEVLSGTPEGEKLEQWFWLTADAFPKDKNHKPREAAMLYRAIYDGAQGDKKDYMKMIYSGAFAYRDAHLPPNRKDDETRFMTSFLGWLEQQGWESALREGT